jgi:parallel beta-helix repeat protein
MVRGGKIIAHPFTVDFKNKILSAADDPRARISLDPTQPVSYIVFQDEGMIKAKNGQTGEIEFSSPDAATVIQQAIDAGGGLGSRIVLKITEDWIISRKISLAGKHYTTIEQDLGMNLVTVGGKNPRLILANGVNDAMFSTDGVVTYGIILRGLRIYGNKANQTGGLYLVDLLNCYNAVVENCTIEMGYLHGLRLTSASWLVNSFIRDHNGLGVFAGGDVKVIGNEFSSNGWLSTNPATISSVYCAGSNIVAGNNIYSNPYASGIYADGYYNNIYGNRISEVGYHGILLRNCKYSFIHDNIITAPGRAASNSYDGIRLIDGTENCVVVNNFIRDVHTDGQTSMVRYGIIDVSTTQNNYIKNNKLVGTFLTGKLYLKNPRPLASITVGPSPFTYTNNDEMPVFVQVTGGTVTDISYVRGGVSTSLGITSGIIWLGPKDAITVTYTVAPTMRVIPTVL